MRIREYFKALLGGCGVETDMLEAESIIRDMAEMYQMGELSEEEILSHIQKMCNFKIVPLASRCGKPISVEKCVDDLMTLVKTEPTAGALMSIRKSIRARRARRSESRGVGLL